MLLNFHQLSLGYIQRVEVKNLQRFNWKLRTFKTASGENADIWTVLRDNILLFSGHFNKVIQSFI